MSCPEENASQSKADEKSNDQKEKDVTKKQKRHSTNHRISERVRMEIDPNKSIQNQAKMAPWRCLGDVWGLLGTSRGPVQQNQSQFEGFWKASGTSREAPGDPGPPKKSSKNNFFAKKKVFQTRFFVNVCA